MQKGHANKPQYIQCLVHTIFHHTIFGTQLCHAPSFATPSFTHRFVTHHLSHTTLSPLSFTHNFHTHDLSHKTLSHTPFSLSHTIFHTTLSHTHTIFLRQTQSFIYTALSHTTLHIQLVLLFGPPPPPLSFLPCYNICCSLLEEVDLWGSPVL